VVLSACNTAAADGSGEGLSGLVRGFFFAGAPALLVSHWSVGERATAALMTALFAASSEGPGRLRAARLQQAMRTLMTQARGETAYFAHPYAWAAFFLVGEGGMP
jgi:CHAT domain-containing protein